MMMLVLFSSDWNHHIKLLATIFVDYAKMALPLTHSSVNGPSEKMTGLDNGLHHDVYTIEKENIDAIVHMDQPCNATELCMFIGYINYYCTCCRFRRIH
jgi:hypothetical protein